MPKVSVVIPCYNQGIYIDEAVNSVLAQSFRDFEIIIVNDGSTDDFTNNLLADYDRLRTRVIFSENEGVSAARNRAISNARGKYILPLDSDDKIGERYLEKAVDVLDRKEEVGIVYCGAEFFGEKQGEMDSPEFSLEDMLLENLIFCSGVYRKKHWKEVGGYNANMVDGYEDWDFWLSILELVVDVYKIPEKMFFYRIKEDSRNKSIMEQDDKKLKVCLQIIENHKDLYSNNMEAVIRRLRLLSDVVLNTQRELGRIKLPMVKSLHKRLSDVFKIGK